MLLDDETITEEATDDESALEDAIEDATEDAIEDELIADELTRLLMLELLTGRELAVLELAAPTTPQGAG